MDKVWRDRWALVTGASSGIGVALAKELASGGAHLVLTARRANRLEELSHNLRNAYGIQTEVFPADLVVSDAPEKIYAFTREKGMAIDLLINNAGFGQYGELTRVDPGRLLDMVQVNCTAVVHLTRLFLADMVQRRRGDVLILASTAAFQAVPYISTYAATKVFDCGSPKAWQKSRRNEGLRNTCLRAMPRIDGI
jgi:short-subunit dehydrogenase